MKYYYIIVLVCDAMPYQPMHSVYACDATDVQALRYIMVFVKKGLVLHIYIHLGISSLSMKEK